MIEVADNELTVESSGPAWHSDHPLFWRWFGYYWLRIRIWLWDRGGSKLYWRVGKRPPITKWWIRWCDPGFRPCEECGYEWEWGDHDGWFKCERTGTSFNGECTFHWFEGIQTCPRCRSTWDYGDSD